MEMGNVVNPQTIREGFWRSRENEKSDLSWPVQNSEPVSLAFLERLDEIQNLAGKDARVEKILYRGYSPCRLCDKSNNGCAEYHVTTDNCKSIFPAGLAHYLKDHNVHPSPEFVEFINNFK